MFHRWHHPPEEAGLDKNFASTFPVLDVIFGTFYMPAGKLPEQFGTGEPDFPEGFLGQLLHPFRRIPARPELPGQRRVRAAFAWAAGLGLVGVSLLGGGLLYAVWLANRDGQLVQEQERVEAIRQSQQLEQPRQAYAENDLVRATALLEGVGGPHATDGRGAATADLCETAVPWCSQVTLGQSSAWL